MSVVPLRVSDRAFALDAGVIAVVSGAICVASDQLAFMTVLVPAVLLLRLVLFARLPRAERGPFGVELAFFAICLGVGAFNDWNSVVVHRIYDYDAPVYFPAFSTIPLWMLAFWGMILRFFATMARWERLGPPDTLSDTVRLPGRSFRSGSWKVGLMLVVVFATRQTIYRFFEEPILSWVPFVAALLVFGLLFGFDRHDRKLLATFAVGGPAIEVLYIQVGGLHHYHLGWLLGVPLWIALWWLVAILVWKDISGRLQAFLCIAAARAGGAASPRPRPARR